MHAKCFLSSSNRRCARLHSSWFVGYRYSCHCESFNLYFNNFAFNILMNWSTLSQIICGYHRNCFALFLRSARCVELRHRTSTHTESSFKRSAFSRSLLGFCSTNLAPLVGWHSMFCVVIWYQLKSIISLLWVFNNCLKSIGLICIGVDIQWSRVPVFYRLLQISILADWNAKKW